MFLSVAENGSFRRAADDLGLSAPLVSQIVARLEEDMGQQLLYRTTRKVTLTDAGSRLASGLGQAFEDIGEFLDDFRQGRVRPCGRLRVSAPTILAQPAFARFLHGYLAENPELQVDVDLSDDHRDPLAHGHDIALRVTRPGSDDDRIRRRLFETEAFLCTGPGTKVSGPESVTDLLYLRPPELPPDLEFRQGGQVQRLSPARQMVVNHAGLVRELLRFGGCAIFPAFSVAEALARGDLQRILPDCDFGPVEVQALYTARRARLSNAKHFADALVAFLEAI
ncbi:MAG: LysR family transcriptional regulator [Nitratireductor sp.]